MEDYKKQALAFYARDAALSYEQGKYKITVALCDIILRLDADNDRAIRLRDASMTALRERQPVH